MIADTNDWYHYIRNHHFNFCLGTKLHGSIMSILAGVPTMMITVDTCTAEVAEYMNIPSFTDTGRKVSAQDFYRLYEELDYSVFNSEFEMKYRVFEKFLIDHKIVKCMNNDNRFFRKSGSESFDQYLPNQQRFISYTKRLKKNGCFCHLVNVGCIF